MQSATYLVEVTKSYMLALYHILSQKELKKIKVRQNTDGEELSGATGKSGFYHNSNDNDKS